MGYSGVLLAQHEGLLWCLLAFRGQERVPGLWGGEGVMRYCVRNPFVGSPKVRQKGVLKLEEELRILKVIRRNRFNSCSLPVVMPVDSRELGGLEPTVLD